MRCDALHCSASGHKSVNWNELFLNSHKLNLTISGFVRFVAHPTECAYKRTNNDERMANTLQTVCMEKSELLYPPMTCFMIIIMLICIKFFLAIFLYRKMDDFLAVRELAPQYNIQQNTWFSHVKDSLAFCTLNTIPEWDIYSVKYWNKFLMSKFAQWSSCAALSAVLFFFFCVKSESKNSCETQKTQRNPFK